MYNSFAMFYHTEHALHTEQPNEKYMYICYVTLKINLAMKQIDNKQWTVYLIKYQGKVMYVGKTCNFEKRKYDHIHNQGGKRDRHSAIPIDADLNEIEILPVDVLETNEDALRREDKLICEYGTIHNGWNQCRSGLISKDENYGHEYEVERKKLIHTYEKYYQKHPEHYDFPAKLFFALSAYGHIKGQF